MRRPRPMKTWQVLSHMHRFLQRPEVLSVLTDEGATAGNASGAPAAAESGLGGVAGAAGSGGEVVALRCRWALATSVGEKGGGGAGLLLCAGHVRGDATSIHFQFLSFPTLIPSVLSLYCECGAKRVKG